MRRNHFHDRAIERNRAWSCLPHITDETPLLRKLRSEAAQFESLAQTRSHLQSFAQTRRKISYPSSSFIPGCGFTASFHCTGSAGKGDLMSILSIKSSAFILAAAVIGVVS